MKLLSGKFHNSFILALKKFHCFYKKKKVEEALKIVETDDSWQI